jgi:multidrug resistance efflux pump
MMTNRLLTIGLGGLALIMLFAASYHVVARQDREPPLAPPQGPSRAGYDSKIAATGMIEAQSENIALGSALNGVVLEVYVTADHAGQQVKAGAPLFRVDDRNLTAELDLAIAKVATAEAQLRKLLSLPRAEYVPPSEAHVHAAEANAARFQDDYERAEKLAKTRAVTESEVINKRAAYESAYFDLVQAKAQHQLLIAGAWEPDKAIARASVSQAKAEVQRIRTELERAVVRAPLDCRVLHVNVRPGQQVVGNDTKPLMVLGETGELHVRVDIDENDIPRFEPQRSAIAVERGSRQRNVGLEFRRVEPMVAPKQSLSGLNSELIDTRVLQVIYAVKKSEVPLFVGQQVDVFIEAEAPESAHAAP